MREGDNNVKKVYPDLPNWVFEMDEVSSGVYEVIGRDMTGHTTSAKGFNIEELIQNCRSEARRISDELGRGVG